METWAVTARNRAPMISCTVVSTTNKLNVVCSQQVRICMELHVFFPASRFWLKRAPEPARCTIRQLEERTDRWLKLRGEDG